MGTDITRWAERRSTGEWDYCYGAGTASDGRPCPLGFYYGVERNYFLFAILAGVNKITNQGFEPIVPPRGLPGDSPRSSGGILVLPGQPVHP
jgi:hypothetical protein